MKSEYFTGLSAKIEKVAEHLEDEVWTENVKPLRSDSEAFQLNEPLSYLELIGELEEFQRQTRVLFLRSIFNKVCVVEGQAYPFSKPFQAGMRYDAVMKRNDDFYIVDEDQSWREVFTSQKFVKFVDDEYWQLIEGQE